MLPTGVLLVLITELVLLLNSPAVGGQPPFAESPFDAAQAKELQARWARHIGKPVVYTNSIGMRMVLIPPGEFTMGTADDVHKKLMKAVMYQRLYLRYEVPAHRVRITQPFYMSATEVTVGQFRRFVEETGYKTEVEQGRWKNFRGRRLVPKKVNGRLVWDGTWRDLGYDQPEDQPVVNVSWTDAAAFCQWLTEREAEMKRGGGPREGEAPAEPGAEGGQKAQQELRPPKRIYRLPTEAEWEYACRAGTQTVWSFGDRFSPEHAWAAGCGKDRPQPVAPKKPNPFGLYDMHANVWEWCHDWSDYDWPRRGKKGTYYAVSAKIDPTGPDTGRGKVVPGGSFDFGTRSAFRVWGGGPNNRRNHIGFRVAATIEATRAGAVLHSDRIDREADGQTEARGASRPAGGSQKQSLGDWPPAGTLNRKDDGYRGIWYMNQPTPDQYGFKYSGGLGTYCAKHKPFAVYCREVDKTFFCYGGTTADSHRRLVHMVSYYDHRTGRVPRPTVLLDKQTSDAHDNPVIAVDDAGYIWVFSTAHGTARPAYIHRSRRPYDIDQFEMVRPTRLEDSTPVPMTNFSYIQAWHVPGRGFLCFFTRYGYPVARTICFMTSPDGVRWSRWQRLATIGHGHYQISAVGRRRAGSAFNYHPRHNPRGRGANWRTNLYYVETTDFGRTWQTADGTPLELPLTEKSNPALVHDYAADGLNVYLKDIRYDHQDRPIILYLTSKGPMPGPKHGPRTWWTARWTGSRWQIHQVTTSDNNYDMGSLWLEADGTWRVIAPTEPAAQPYATGGEVAMWVSRDQGKSWQKVRQLTSGSQLNHTYVRRPVNAHPDFYAFWADGDALRPSASRLYFCDKKGSVRVLPSKMVSEWALPEPLVPKHPAASPE